MVQISVIATILNEASSIGTLLTSLLEQTRLPDEVVLVDGGSIDGTWNHLEAFSTRAPFPVQIISAPGTNISQGRNIAIDQARGEIIASTDAGVRLSKEWLDNLVNPFEEANPPDVVSGFFVAEPQSLFERALGAVTLPRKEEIDSSGFYPSSRSVAYRKKAWEKVGGYPEWLDYCEDLVFDFALEDAGFEFTFAPEAVVYFRPRSSLRGYIRQYYRYARGDGKADLWRYRHLIRYSTYLIGVPLVLWLTCKSWLGVIPLLLGITGYMLRPARRLVPWLKGLSLKQTLLVSLWGAIIPLAGDLAKMVGYPVGVWWRWHHAPARPWAKRQI